VPPRTIWCTGATFVVHPRDTRKRSRVYADNGSSGGTRSRAAVGEAQVQSAQPRDIGVLILVIGVFLILFVVTLTMGTPLR
jgi:hypothetical protein